MGWRPRWKPTKPGEEKPRKQPLRTLTTREIGATKDGLHVICPCCATRIGVDLPESEQAMLNRANSNLGRKAATRVQHFLTNGWRFKTWAREPKNKLGVRSDSVEAIVSTGAGRAVQNVYRKMRAAGVKTYFLVLWHNAPVFTEMFFACRFGDLFRVLQGICDDSPEFAKRLQQVIDLSLRRDGSGFSHRVVADDAKGTEEVGENLEEVFRQDTAIRL